MTLNRKAKGVLASGAVLGLLSVSFIGDVCGMGAYRPTKMVGLKGPSWEVNAGRVSNVVRQLGRGETSGEGNRFYFTVLGKEKQILNMAILSSISPLIERQYELDRSKKAINDNEFMIPVSKAGEGLLLDQLVALCNEKGSVQGADNKSIAARSLDDGYADFVRALEATVLNGKAEAKARLDALVDYIMKNDVSRLYTNDFAGLKAIATNAAATDAQKDLGVDLNVRWDLLRAVAALAEGGDINAADASNVGVPGAYDMKTIEAVGKLLEGM